eukprot:CAMPEP_0119276666 /NCGR_PEP_ID=MMETSP1329-20130426/15752_1 /TAXON_ID=114041 /ORGANISM="Genus nov. species nov., Strain RCC1024" /LENGTH=435 /DNA_ID=CAMNT_0007277103 /DNA_START=69 /DNA_END=1373 /DNA_ORIENTATION=-
MRLALLIAASAADALRIWSQEDCPDGWHYYSGRCYARGPKGTFEECNTIHCPALANATGAARAPSTLACVPDDATNAFLAEVVGGAQHEPGSWVGLYQDPGAKKKSKEGWDHQSSANCAGVAYAAWYEPWGEPRQQLGCTESCAVMGAREGIGAFWASASCRDDDRRCLCEYPSAASEELAAEPPFSDRGCGVGKLFYAILVLSGCVLACAGCVVGCVVCSNRLEGDRSAGRDGFVGLFPARRGGLYQIASGFEDARVNRLARIVLQLTVSTLLLGLLFKALVVVLFVEFVKREHAVGPAVDLAFHACFSAAAAWLGVKAVRTRNEHYACQSTYLQAFQALVFALGAVSAFMLLLLLLVTSSGERVDVVGVLLNVAFALLYLTTGVYASRLQAEIDALEAPRGAADDAGGLELAQFPPPDGPDDDDAPVVSADPD